MGQTLSAIYNTALYALNLHTEAMARLQEQASTGSRINRTSDEPDTAYKLLELFSNQRSLTTYMDTLSEAVTALQLITTVVKDMVSAFADARTLLTQISSGTYGEAERERTVEAINDILERVVLLGNTKHMGQYVFGGGNTTSAPYVVERTGGQITRVTYQGSREDRNVELAPGVVSNVFQVGENLFCSNRRSEPIFSGLTGAKPGTGTSSVTGDVWLTVTYDGSNYRISIDDGATYVIVPPGGDANQAVTDSRTGKVLYVDTTQITATGVEPVRVPGTYDVFNTLISIRDALANERGLSDAQLRQVHGDAVVSLQEVSNLLIQAEVSTGSKVGFLDDLQNSIQQLKYNAEDQTARLQNADIAQVAIDLSRREVLYQISLSMAARMMSMSLLDFIE